VILIVVSMIVGGAFAGNSHLNTLSQVSMQRFSTKQSCEAARQVVLEHAYQAFAVCVDQ
jgi:hypothetical protein